MPEQSKKEFEEKYRENHQNKNHGINGVIAETKYAENHLEQKLYKLLFGEMKYLMQKKIGKRQHNTLV